MEPSDHERRRHPRIPFTGPVVVIRPDSVATLAARDICPGGIFLAARELPEVGSALRVELALDRTRRLERDGRVVRAAHGAPVRGFAVCFQQTAEQEQVLAQALAG